MKKMILKSMISMTTVALFVAASGQALAQQQSNAAALDFRHHHNEQLEGVWSSSVTLTDCNGHTIAAFRAFNMFNRGGTINDGDNAPPGMHGPGLGTWEYLGGSHYSSLFYFFNFNPDGTFKGVQKIHRQIVLSHDGESFTSTIAFEGYDANGNLLVTGCGTESAVRLP